MARGGKRQGRTGALYPERRDLALGARVPVQAAPGQVYGAAGKQRAAQQAVPLRAVPSPGPAAAPGGGLPGSPPPLPPLDAITSRPGEPVTAGSAFGPGPGPEALAGPNPLLAATAALNGLGAGANPDMARMRDVLNAALANENLR